MSSVLLKTQNYENELCIHGDQFNSCCWFDLFNNVWRRCESPYCYIHGHKNRERKALKAERKFAGDQFIYCVTFNPATPMTLATGRQICTLYMKEMHKKFKQSEIMKVEHWHEIGKLLIKKPDWHFLISSNELITRKANKAIITFALNEFEIPKPTTERIGFQWRYGLRHYLDYLFRIYKHKDELILPPADMKRWEFCRIIARKETK